MSGTADDPNEVVVPGDAQASQKLTAEAHDSASTKGLLLVAALLFVAWKLSKGRRRRRR